MGTKSELTLNIKDFLGISRFYNSIGEPPNKLFTIQNMWQRNKGELESVGGITKLTGTAIPGLAEIKHTEWYSDDWDVGLVVFYKPSVSSIPTPIGFVVTPVGGGTVTRNFWVEFIGPGGSRGMTTVATPVLVGTGGITITPPTNTPSYVHHINYYIQVGGAGNFNGPIWCGSMSRRAAGFATSLSVPKLEPSMTASALQVSTPDDAKITLTTLTGGTLTGGRKYYFGLVPLVKGDPAAGSESGPNLAALVDINSHYFVFNLPPDGNMMRINFETNNSKIDGTTETPPAWICMFGTSPEDLLPVCGLDGAVTILPSIAPGSNYVFDVLEVPYNSNMYTQMEAGVSPGGSTGIAFASNRYNPQVLLQPDAVSITPFDTFPAPSSSNVDTTFYGAVYLSALPYSAAASRHLLPNNRFGQKSYYANSEVAFVGVPSDNNVYFKITPAEVYTRLLGARLFCSNGKDSPFYTNSYSIKTLCVDYQTANAPISNYVEVFQNRLIFSGGRDNLQNVAGLAYYSEAANPFSFTAVPGPAAQRNFINVNQPGGSTTQTAFAGGSQVIGLGVYSQDLVTTGPGSFLVVGKQNSIFSWNGGLTTASIITQIDKKTGFAGSRCFVRTKDGPIFVGQDNVYLMSSGQNIIPIGDEVYTIIRSLTPNQLAAVNVCYHDSVIKIAYDDTGDGTVKNKELWLSMNIEEGERIRRWVGPHALTNIVTQAVTEKFGTTQNYRVSGYLTDIFRRDDYSSYVNNGSAINYSLIFNDLDLQNPDLWKLVTRLYLRMKNNEALTITGNVACYDYGPGQGQANSSGVAQTATLSISVPYAGGVENYRLNQGIFSANIRGAIVRPSFTWSASTKVSLETLSILFKTLQRRRL